MSLFSRKPSVDAAERRTREARRELYEVLDRLHDAIDKYEESTREVSDARNGFGPGDRRAQDVSRRGDHKA